MSNPCCADCSHYLRHYTLDNGKIFRVHCGHCTFGRPRRKQPDAKVCENFVPGPRQEETFATKEYLSKELLRYMQSLELLPEIEDRG